RSSFPATTHSVRTLPAPDPHPLPERRDIMTAPSPGRLTPLDDALAIGIGAQSGPVPELSTRASLEHPSAAVISAELLATAHGVYDASLNGSPVTDSGLNPGWTVYESRLQVQRFDVTEQVRAGGPEIELSAVLDRKSTRLNSSHV